MLSTPLEYPPGEAQIYSDIGADVLGFVVEAITGERLDAFVERRIFRPTLAGLTTADLPALLA